MTRTVPLEHQQIAIVLGASRGIGAATASRLARDGFRVFGTHRGSGLPDGIEAVEADLRDDDSLNRAFRQVQQRAGRLDVLVASAGVAEQIVIPRLTREHTQELFNVNTFGPMMAVKHAARIMNRQQSGSIVLVSSESSRAGIPGSSHYTASKAALEGFARSAMWEYGPRGIRINVVAPGSTETDMFAAVDDAHRKQLLARTPLGRFAEAAEIAEVITWVAQSTYLTGACIPVTGGEGLGY